MHLFARPELRVGIVGHRLNQLPEAARPRLRATIAGVLGVMEEIGEAAGAGRVRDDLAAGGRRRSLRSRGRAEARLGAGSAAAVLDQTL
ncbi:MAG: hypothetical protein WDN76_13520 [Alphaproteobacteria bacterium]